MDKLGCQDRDLGDYPPTCINVTRWIAGVPGHRCSKLADPSRYPAILGILRLSSLITERDPGGTYAGYVIVGLPLLVLFAISSRSFIRGMTLGAIKKVVRR